MRVARLLSVVTLASALQAAPAAGDEGPFRAVVKSNGVQRVEMIGGAYFFFPSHIIVKQNIPVELVVRKESGMVPHNIVMKAPEAGLHFEETLEDTPKVIRFTPKKTGSYPFYCSKKLPFFPSHRDKGMEGVLEVTE